MIEGKVAVKESVVVKGNGRGIVERVTPAHRYGSYDQVRVKLDTGARVDVAVRPQ